MQITPLLWADELIVMPRAPLVMMAVCISALAIAFVAQFAYGENPCVLCLWQRVPFAIAILVSGLAYLLRNKPILVHRSFIFLALLFLVEMGIAFFHSGVELHWWLGTDGCTVEPLKLDQLDPAAVREAMLHAPVARCDVISWTFLGYSMANWNVLFSLGLSVFSLMAAHGVRTGRRFFAPKKEGHVKPTKVKD
jgi:disulfide bond formation protein DsbB